MVSKGREVMLEVGKNVHSLSEKGRRRSRMSEQVIVKGRSLSDTQRISSKPEKEESSGHSALEGLG